MQHGFLEKIFGANGGHLGTTALPLCFDEDLSFDVCLLALLFLLNFLILICFELLLLLLAEFAIEFLVLLEVLFAHFALFKFNPAEWELLDKTSCTSERLDVLTWHLNIDHINDRLTKSIHEDNLDLDRARLRKDVHLEHFLDLEMQIGPAHKHLVSLGDLNVIDEEHCIELQLFDFILAGFFIRR